jgi:malate synthase
MTVPFLQSYVNLLIQICHKRGIHAMGGMAAQIPIKNDEEANQQAFARVYADKKREVLAGHDGTWVAHPGLISVALKAFDEFMPKANQLDKIPEGFITEADLLAVPKGEITEQGVRGNIAVGILYIESWLKGNGSVPIRNLMEDAATAEICRAQLWQWCKFSAALNNGSKLTPELLQQWIDEEYALLNDETQSKQSSHYLKSAKELFEHMIFKQDFDDFLTTQAYSHLIKRKDY